jgi:hypothetical protein
MFGELHQLITEGRPTEDFRTASLGVHVLKHHGLKVVLCLGISVPEKRGLFGFTDDVGNAEVVAVDGHQASEWVSGPSRRNDAEKDEDQYWEEPRYPELLFVFASPHVRIPAMRMVIPAV